jgi:hypothetical protein
MTTTSYLTTTCVKADEQSSHKDRMVLPSPAHEPHLTEPRAFYSADDSDDRSSPFTTTRRRRPAEPAAVYSVDEYDDRPSSSIPSHRYYQAAPATTYCVGKEDICFLLLNTMHGRRQAAPAIVLDGTDEQAHMLLLCPVAAQTGSPAPSNP